MQRQIPVFKRPGGQTQTDLCIPRLHVHLDPIDKGLQQLPLGGGRQVCQIPLETSNPLDGSVRQRCRGFAGVTSRPLKVADLPIQFPPLGTKPIQLWLGIGQTRLVRGLDDQVNAPGQSFALRPQVCKLLLRLGVGELPPARGHSLPHFTPAPTAYRRTPTLRVDAWTG